jgi:hypothetical protein
MGGGATKIPKWPRGQAKAIPLDREIVSKIKPIIIIFFIYFHLPLSSLFNSAAFFLFLLQLTQMISKILF